MRYLGIAGAVGMGLLSSGIAAADVVTDWNATAVDVGRRLTLGPNPASRLVAITQIAVFEAVNSVGREYQPYHAYLTPSGPVSLEAAVAQAAHDALLALAPSRASDLDFQLQLSLDDIPDGPEKSNGIELGQLAAGSIYVNRLSDGSSAVVAYPGSSDLGKWRPTPRVPEFLASSGGAGAGGAGAGGAAAGAGGSAGAVNPPLAASDPQWGAVTPFGLLSGSQFRAEPPPLLTSAEYATALNEVKDIGAGTGSTRTAEQTQIAKFWAQQTHIPFNDIARTVANRKHFTVPQSAHLFALLNIALADARIAVWDTKYYYGYWRPITALRSADLDGNDATELNATWNSLLDTPNHPEYVSGHSATGAAGAAVLAAIFGDATGFAVHSDTLTGIGRDFDSFSAAAAENAMSRLYGGIHYRFSNERGLAIGAAVADYELSHQLLLVSDSNGAGGAGGESGSASEAGNGEAGTPAASGGKGGKGSGGTSPRGGKGGKGGGAKGGTGASGGTGGAPTSAGSGGSDTTAGTGGSTSAEGGQGGTSPGAGKGGAAGHAGKGSSSAPASSGTDDSGCAIALPKGERTASAPWFIGLALLAWRGRRRSPRSNA
ncbi:MAG TPA: vanadium-dependent haloperoxidase [Polyangiaceae bacterium]|nr:vanadium-dependent haloperoxidase [Polyangiaceae bacterium]